VTDDVPIATDIDGVLSRVTRNPPPNIILARRDDPFPSSATTGVKIAAFVARRQPGTESTEHAERTYVEDGVSLFHLY
jgi:hypothetical protein